MSRAQPGQPGRFIRHSILPLRTILRYHTHTEQRTTLNAAILAVLLACHVEPARQTNGQRPATSGGAARPVVDSTEAIQLALRVNRNAGILSPIAVTSFERDSLGYLIGTSPTKIRVIGGAMLIRIHTNGSAEIVRETQ